MLPCAAQLIPRSLELTTDLLNQEGLGQTKQHIWNNLVRTPQVWEWLKDLHVFGLENQWSEEMQQLSSNIESCLYKTWLQGHGVRQGQITRQPKEFLTRGTAPLRYGGPPSPGKTYPILRDAAEENYAIWDQTGISRDPCRLWVLSTVKARIYSSSPISQAGSIQEHGLWIQAELDPSTELRKVTHTLHASSPY